jgi:hypothetical protein
LLWNDSSRVTLPPCRVKRFAVRGDHLDSVPANADDLLRDDHPIWSDGDELLGLALPHLALGDKELPDFLEPAIDAGVGKDRGRIVHDGMGIPAVWVELTHAAEMLVATAHDLHVLLRHRLLRQPGGFARGILPTLNANDGTELVGVGRRSRIIDEAATVQRRMRCLLWRSR